LWLISAPSIGHSLFSTELFYQRDAYAEGIGGIYCFESPALAQKHTAVLKFDTSYISQFIMRDTLSFYRFIPMLDLGLDFIFVPGFNAVDDTGIEHMIFPFAVAARLQGYILNNKTISLKLGGFLGVENVAEYAAHPVIGLNMGFSLMLTPWLSWGITGGINDMNIALVQTGFLFDAGWMRFYPVFDLTGIEKSLKIGIAVPLSKSFALLFGGDFSIDYSGWSVNFGTDISELNLFGLPSALGTSLAYNLAVGVTFQISLSLAFGS
jgi:hypothetical protein